VGHHCGEIIIVKHSRKGLAFTAIVALLAVCTLAAKTSAGERPLYTPEQAAVGAKAFAMNCARCHGAQLQGISAPALKGPGSALTGESVSQAYMYISTQMPADGAGSLTPSQYAAIMAFILQQRGHRAGSIKLKPAAAMKIELDV
jgi:polar amino acid transport system substrate-binding protein